MFYGIIQLTKLLYIHQSEPQTFKAIWTLSKSFQTLFHGGYEFSEHLCHYTNLGISYVLFTERCFFFKVLMNSYCHLTFCIFCLFQMGRQRL